jgi:hypothetical protein
MSSPPSNSQKLVPAQVGFLAIYNPSLGNTDETLDDQIVYYSSPETRKRKRSRRRTGVESPAKSSQEERNERLRKIGLAQGMVEFGRDFSDGKPIDTIETEKSRIILHELESGWWMIAVSPSDAHIYRYIQIILPMLRSSLVHRSHSATCFEEQSGR